MRIAPFDPLRPPADRAARVASPPYDVVNAEEARAVASESADSFMHVIRAEVDLPEGTNPYSERVYLKAAENLGRLQDSGALQRHGRRSLFVYRQRMGTHTQEGLVCCCHAEDYRADVIKKHEKTRPDKEDDRTRHMLAIRAHPGPVFLTYRDDPEIAALFGRTIAKEPIYDFVASDGVTHTVWEVDEAQPWVDAFEAIPVSYVADGHHRSASAARVAATCAQEDSNHQGDEEYNWFLAVLFPASSLKILAYNRFVHDLNGMRPKKFLAKLRERGVVEEGATPPPTKPGSVDMLLEGKWYRLDFPRELRPAGDPVASLDVSLLQDQVLGPLLGIDDPRTSDRIDFVGGIHGVERLVKMAKRRPGSVAFYMYPTTVQQLMAIADAGAIMPPKSTWFEPKLRSGLLVHTF